VAQESLELPEGATVRDALTALVTRHGEQLERVLAASSFLVDGVAVRDRELPLVAGVELDILPPFAGG
jgi:molybdopterin converting factor small subunit